MSVRLPLIALTTVALLAVACSNEPDAATPVDTAQGVLALVADSGFDPTQAPPTDLTVIDIQLGDGAEAGAGDAIDVHYTGVFWNSGELFDSSWSRNMPLSFGLGQGQVITGWDQGVVGMREGGRRLLILPPDFAYGASGFGPIGPNETLIFVVDLITAN